MTVTIEIPASVPAQIRKPEGDAGGADGLATTIYAAAGRYEEFADRCRELQELGSWAGIAYQSYKEASGEASTEHSAMATTVRRVEHLDRADFGIESTVDSSLSGEPQHAALVEYCRVEVCSGALGR